MYNQDQNEFFAQLYSIQEPQYKRNLLKPYNPKQQKSNSDKKQNNHNQLPSEKIAEKLKEDDFKKQRLQKEAEENEKVFEERIENFTSCQNIFDQLEESFNLNKDLFQNLWEKSENPLQDSLTEISKTVLEPQKIQLNIKEKEITQSLQSMLVIGRSGTGKTTTAALKLASMQMSFQKESSKQNNFQFDQLRLGFTTVSNYLKLEVHNFYRKATSASLNEELIPNRLSLVEQWPLFTNIKQLIHLIDGNLAIPFIQRHPNGNFVTDKFELQIDDQLKVKLKKEKQYYEQICINQFVDIFWHSNKYIFDHYNVDPFITYSQIQSYITGHFESHKSNNNMIDLERYIYLVGKTKTHLENEQKENIYSICQKYQDWKVQNRYFDQNDQVNYILKCIQENQYDAKSGFFHYLYIDEVQDLNCACLYLLCLLTEQSVYLGGDTAQTISSENAFRFTNLRSLFETEQFGKDFKTNKIIQQSLKEEQLTQNFRSHGQIIELNNAIVKILEIFFPTSIDHLIPEISLKSGPKPNLIHSRNDLYSFLNQESDKSKESEYFVKDQKEKENLRKILSNENKKYQIFTIVESKGLEFQDVITYNLLSYSFKQSQCWNALNLLKVEEQNISLEDFQKDYSCKYQIQNILSELKDEFEGSTFTRIKGKDSIKMKVLSKKDNADSQIKSDYSKDFNKLIGELKRIYVAFSRARSRVFIYEDSISAGKQQRNPIIKLFQELNLLDLREINEKNIQIIKNEHLKYIKENEPIKKNKDQFISIAQQLCEKNQFSDASYFYEMIGDEYNQMICEAKAKIYETNRIIEQNKEQFEKERKSIIEYSTNPKNYTLFSQIKSILLQAIKLLEETKQFELIAKMFYRLGQYTQAIEYFSKYKDLLNQSDSITKDEQIKEINNNIKSLYLYKADLLERSKNQSSQLQVQSFYEEFDQFLEKEKMFDQNNLYIAFRLNNISKLFQSLVYFKQNNLIKKENLIKTLHYYYPYILEQELKKINEISEITTLKKQQKYKLANILVELLQTLIIPFQEEFQIIARSRQNMEYYDWQLQFFVSIQNIDEFKEVDQEQNIINSKNLMMFYIMLVHFNCLTTQIKFSQIVQSNPLAHILYLNQLFNQQNNQNKTQEIIYEISKIYWMRSANQGYIDKDKKMFYIFLGLYNQLVNPNFQLIEVDYYFQLTLDLSLNKKIQIISCPNDEQIVFQQIVNNELLLPQIWEYQNQNRMYHNFSYLFQTNLFEYTPNFVQVISELTKWIKAGYIDGYDIHAKFTRCQDLLFYFYRCLVLNVNIPIFENYIIEQISTIVDYIINFNYSLESTNIISQDNQIFIDAFCSIFGQSQSIC